MHKISLVSIVFSLLVVIDYFKVKITAKRDYYTFDDEDDTDYEWHQPRKQVYRPPTPPPCYDYEPIVAYDLVVRGIVYNPLYLKTIFKYIKGFEIRGWLQVHPRPRNEMTGYFEGRQTPMKKMKNLVVTGGNIFEIFRSVVITNERFLTNFTMIGFYMKPCTSDLTDEIHESVFKSGELPPTSSDELSYSYT